ncbi:MAG: hypothetical protein KBF12_10650 [Sebaldella sp.]|nr:hypothetical protein [Sebaldella sp.]
MSILQSYINKTYKEKNNLKHRIRVFNKTKNVDITEYLDNDTLEISRFLENETQSIAANTLDLTFLPPEVDKATEKEIIYFGDSDKSFDVYDMLFTDFKDSYKNNIININDEIHIIDIFDNTELSLFVGIVTKPVIRREHLRTYIKLTLEDRTSIGYKKRFDKDYVYQGYYAYHSGAKNQSLLYKLAIELGFQDSDIEIEEMKHTLGDYIIIPVAKFEKDNQIIEELVTLVRAVVGDIWVTRDGKLKITSLLNQKDTNRVNYKLKYGNILNYLESTITKPETNKVEVSFTENKTNPREAVFILAGQNANYENDDAKVKVPANTLTNNEYWQIKYLTDYVNNLEKTPEVVAYIPNSDGTKTYIAYTDYELILDNDGGKVKFFNHTASDIFIEKFKIYGEPIKVYTGNKVTYTEKNLADHEIELHTYENKYVQDIRLAQSVARYLYFKNCREKTTHKMRTNTVPFLELQDVIKLEFEDITKDIQLTKITQKQNELEIEAIEYEEYKPNTEYFENQKSNLFDESYLNNGYIEHGNIKYPTDKSPAPINLIPEHMHLGVGASWDKVNRDDIQEYLVYMKGITEQGNYTGLNLKFSRGNSTSFLANAEPGFYEIKVSCITMAGVESDQSTAVIAKSLEITGEQIGVDGDTIVVDTGSKKLILGTVYAKNISANSILANHIAANQIEAKHVKADSITTDKIKFGVGDAIQKGSNGIEVKLLNGNSLDISGMLQVFSKAGLAVYNNTTDANSTKKTVVQGGMILFYERSP